MNTVFQAPVLGRYWAVLGCIIMSIMGRANPAAMRVNVARLIQGDWKRAMAKALPKNGAVQGVAIIVVRMPLKNALWVFLARNRGMGMAIALILIKMMVKNRMMSPAITRGDCS